MDIRSHCSCARSSWLLSCHQLFNDAFPGNNCSDILFTNLIHQARVNAGKCQSSGQVMELVRWFQQQRREPGGESGYFNVELDDEDKCSRVFFMTADMVTSFRGNGQFLIMDATCNTNRFGMQLVLLAGVDQLMFTTIFAVALVRQEDIESYRWLLSQSRDVIGMSQRHSNVTANVWPMSA